MKYMRSIPRSIPPKQTPKHTSEAYPLDKPSSGDTVFPDEPICAVMHPESHTRWGFMCVWQRDLQQRCANHTLPCPFWYAVIYGLDLGASCGGDGCEVKSHLLPSWPLPA